MPDRLCRRVQVEGALGRVAVRASRDGWLLRWAGALYERVDRVADEVVGDGVGVGEEVDREAVAERD